MKVGIIYKKEKIKDEGVIGSLLRRFEEKGVTAFVIEKTRGMAEADVVLVLGGDGAMLHSAVEASRNHIPILGINYGTLGFLTEFESKDTQKAVDLIAGGNYNVQRRSLLEAQIGGKTFYCLNEVSLQRNSLSSSLKQMVEFQAEMGQAKIENILSDGLIVCTPTGSTAYSLSAGGSIMTPTLNAFMLTPICAFSLRSRPIVFPDSEVLKIGIARSGDAALLYGDGRVLSEVRYGDTVTVKKAPFTADFIAGGGQAFFERLNNKIGI